VQSGKSSTRVAVERVKAVLQSQGMTLHQVSQTIVEVFGRSSPYFVPHNFYYDLGLGSFSPSLHQIFALSKVSGYRFYDWLRVFGFPPEEITHQQTLLESKRTSLIDTSLQDPGEWISWFQERLTTAEIGRVVPLRRILRESPAFRAVSFGLHDRFLYAKIGNEDALAFPNLLSGSIVRADTHCYEDKRPTNPDVAKGPLFIVEHSGGICCCELRAGGEGRLVLISSGLPYAQIELKLAEEAKVLGVIDLEIRSLLRPEQPDVPAELARRWRPSRLFHEELKLSTLLHRARNKMGWSFREASMASKQIAERLGDEQYFAAPGSLSDFEAVDTPPRHVQKVLTLCTIYGIHLRAFLNSVGINWNDADMEPIPDALIPRKSPLEATRLSQQANLAENVFLPTFMNTPDEEVPLFMRHALTNISGLKHPKLNDFFWSSTGGPTYHWLFSKDCLFMVNRQKKKPCYSRKKLSWQQPIYLVLKRDGTYLCACCSLEEDLLIIHAQVDNPVRQPGLRNHHDAEVVGQIVGVCRRL